MNIGTIIAWVLQNTGFISTVIQAIETIATELQQVHGNTSVDAYAKAVLAAIEGFFQGLGANTTTTAAEQATIGANTGVVAAVAAAPGTVTTPAQSTSAAP